MRKFLQNVGVKFEGDKLFVPEYSKRVKIDVGLSVNAPQSAVWLDRDHDLFIFGFEPLESNISQIITGKSIWPINLSPQLIGKEIIIVPVALSNKNNLEGRDFYVTEKDPGCSSLLLPAKMDVARIEKVPVITLDSFLSYFPFERFSYIEHLKIDVQGADFEVIKGAEQNLRNFLVITMEIDTLGYVGSSQSIKTVMSYMKKKDFILLSNSIWGKLRRRLRRINISLETDDPTFLNYKLYCDLSKPHRFVYQRG